MRFTNFLGVCLATTRASLGCEASLVKPDSIRALEVSAGKYDGRAFPRKLPTSCFFIAWAVAMIYSLNPATGSPSGEVIPLLETPRLIQILKSTSGRHGAAAAELFRRGEDTIPELEAAGAKPMLRLSPPRLDVVYTLIQRKKPAGTYDPDSFGLHTDPKLDAHEINRIGERHGFFMPNPDRPRGRMTLWYVSIKPGKDLLEVMKSAMTDEAVTTVNMNYIEH